MTARAVIWSLIIATVLFLCVASTARCKIPPKTPGDVLCKAEMSHDTCYKFQDLLRQFGHNLTVIEGTIYATAREIKQNTFVAVLKCRDSQGNIFVVGVKYFKNDFQKVKVQPIDEKWTGI